MQVGVDIVCWSGLGVGVVWVYGIDKVLVFISDVILCYVKVNFFEGGKQVVVEVYCNLMVCGVLFLVMIDNLNFGNFEKFEIMGQLVGVIKGIGEVCVVLDFLIVLGNVLFYNEMDGKGILFIFIIGGVGLIVNLDDLIVGLFLDGDVVLVIGMIEGYLGQFVLVVEVFGIEVGDVLYVDLVVECKNGEFLCVNCKLFSLVSDLLDGGFVLVVFEMVEVVGIGVMLDSVDIGQFFGEDQVCYLVVCLVINVEVLQQVVVEDGVVVLVVGCFGGVLVSMGGEVVDLVQLLMLYCSVFEEQFNLVVV